MPSPIKLDLQSLLGSSITEPAALARKGKARSPRLSLVFAVLAAVVMMTIASPRPLLAQSSSAGQNPSGEPEAVTSGGYLIHSSGELGYRSSNVTGSVDMYDTLVNFQTGPRILDQTLSINRSITRAYCSTIFTSTA